MLRKRTVSNDTSNVFESGGLPDGGNNKSHCKSLITRGFNLKRVALFALRAAAKLAGRMNGVQSISQSFSSFVH